jgi:hypothetical protein
MLPHRPQSPVLEEIALDGSVHLLEEPRWLHRNLYGRDANQVNPLLSERFDP